MHRHLIALLLAAATAAGSAFSLLTPNAAWLCTVLPWRTHPRMHYRTMAACACASCGGRQTMNDGS